MLLGHKGDPSVGLDRHACSFQRHPRRFRPLRPRFRTHEADTTKEEGSLTRSCAPCSRSSRPPSRAVRAALAAAFLLALAGPTAAEKPPETTGRERPAGWLPGTVGEEQAGYPYEGRRSGGEVHVRARVRDSITGSPFELQRDDTIPRSLILQEASLWTGHDGATLFELRWDQPTEDDSRFEGRYRDLRNFDLSYRRDDSRWFERPGEVPSLSFRQWAGGRLRKWSWLQLDAEVENARVQRNKSGPNRDARWDGVAGDMTAWIGTLQADVTLSQRSYVDLQESTAGYDDQHVQLHLGRDIGPNTHLRAGLRTDERTLAATGDTQRDLQLSLSSRTYDLFERPGLKLKTQAVYSTRPDGFQVTQDDDESLRLGFQFAYDTDLGAFEVGYRQIEREVFRLPRSGWELLLQNPATTRARLRGLMEKYFPEERKLWAKATMPIRRKARLFARFGESSVGGPARTGVVADRAPPLEYTNTRKGAVGLSVFPWEGVDLRLERSSELRYMAGRGDHFLGQEQRLEHAFVHLHLGFLPRVDVNLQASNFDVLHVDDVVQAGAIGTVSNYSLDLSYALSRTVSLESAYQRLDHDGADGAMQEIVEFAIDIGASHQPAYMRLGYTLDDFFDDLDEANSVQARVVQISAGAKF